MNWAIEVVEVWDYRDMEEMKTTALGNRQHVSNRKWEESGKICF